MANFGQGKNESFSVTEDLSAKQYFLMKKGTTKFFCVIGRHCWWSSYWAAAR